VYENVFFENTIKKIKEKKNKDLFLFGTGEKILDMPENLKKVFYENSIKFEIMNSLSAYKTYNILLHEGRSFISIIKIL
tara:strand:- start:14 stop:250 length:237 start_codon:yes stop_codon:yes gene_type:complete